MTEEKINGELLLTLPDGFRTLSGEERRKLTYIGGDDWPGFSDPERHVLLTAGWKRIPLFSAWLLSAKDLAKNTEKQLRAAMQPFGYRLLGFAEQAAAGGRMPAFRYAYEKEGVGMRAEACVLKRGRTVYWLYYYEREALEDPALRDSILGSARFAEE